MLLSLLWRTSYVHIPFCFVCMCLTSKMLIVTILWPHTSNTSNTSHVPSVTFTKLQLAEHFRTCRCSTITFPQTSVTTHHFATLKSVALVSLRRLSVTACCSSSTAHRHVTSAECSFEVAQKSVSWFRNWNGGGQAQRNTNTSQNFPKKNFAPLS